MKDLISIIVPIFNTEKYLERCLNSIINQTYKNIEVILIDDGSLDNSLKICYKYANIDRRVKVIHQQNSGPSKARNKGLKEVKGEYFICIDSDDWLEKEMIEILYNNLKKNNVDISICNYYINFETGLQEIKNSINEKNIILTNHKEMYEYLFSDNMFGGYLWNKLIKTSIIKNKDIVLFNEKIMIEEDVLFLIEVIKRCSKICYYPKKFLYHYFQRNNSIVRFKYQLKDLTKLNVLEEKLRIKNLYGIVNLGDKIEYDYIFLLQQALFILKENNMKVDVCKEKLKKARNKYYSIALKQVGFIKKIKLLLVTLFPILYGKIQKKKILLINNKNIKKEKSNEKK